MVDAGREDALTLRPIGVIRTPFADKVSAPRQASVMPDAPATIELLAGQGFEDALQDLDAWDYLWVLFWFHANQGWRPKVLPPRSTIRRGVFATRSPHRPNPIGMSAVKLVRVEKLTVHVRGVDMIDGTPVLDLKPYVPAADALADAGAGWLAQTDPLPPYKVAWSDLARTQADWLSVTHGVDLVTPVERTLVLGPEPHAYRRIRADARGSFLAVRDWRIRFEADVTARVIVVLALETGYRDAQLFGESGARNDDLVPHRALRERWRPAP